MTARAGACRAPARSMLEAGRLLPQSNHGNLAAPIAAQPIFLRWRSFGFTEAWH